MPRITTRTNVYINREKKYRMMVEYKDAIEQIPCEKGAFVMADFPDEQFMLFGEDANAPCASIEVEVIKEVFDTYDHDTLEKVLADMTETVMRYTQIPEDRIFAYYRSSPMWTYKKKDIVGNLLHF